MYLDLIVGMGLVLTAPQAFGWSDMGHSIVGEIAEQNIRPQTKDFVRGVLGIEPLAVAATWPDHVRDDGRFGHKDADPDKRDADIHDFANYHFCEIPSGFTYDTKPNKDVKDCYGAITKSTQLLKDTSGQVSREQKMIALRYLVHVMGDVHQPLHVGTGYDIGGNSCQIRWRNNQTNLHSFWDDGIVQYLGETYATTGGHKAMWYPDYVSNMKRLYPDQFTDLGKQSAYKGDLKQWLLESQQIRDGGVYPDAPGQMQNVKKGEEYKNRPYCFWFSDQTHNVIGQGSALPGKIPINVIPVLDEDTYVKPYAKVAEAQLIKAGLRLAATLDEIAQVVAQSAKPDAVIDNTLQEAVVKSIQDAFRN
jgi:hypothetical protein